MMPMMMMLVLVLAIAVVTAFPYPACEDAQCASSSNWVSVDGHKYCCLTGSLEGVNTDVTCSEPQACGVVKALVYHPPAIRGAMNPAMLGSCNPDGTFPACDINCNIDMGPLTSYSQQCANVPLGSKGRIVLSNTGTTDAWCHLKVYSDGVEFYSKDLSHGSRAPHDFAAPNKGTLSYTVENKNVLFSTHCIVEISGV